MRVAILKYNGGNTVSVANAIHRLGAESAVTDSVEIINSADKVIIPGVGEASSAMESLRLGGLSNVVRELCQPVLGVCLGMQLLCSHSEENDTDCLGILPDRVVKFRESGIKVPHTGWNTVRALSSPLFEGVDEGSFMYFVHSYYVQEGPATIAATEYGALFAAAIAKGNFYGVQFHPEKSGDAGAMVLENFLKL